MKYIQEKLYHHLGTSPNCTKIHESLNSVIKEVQEEKKLKIGYKRVIYELLSYCEDFLEGGSPKLAESSFYSWSRAHHDHGGTVVKLVKIFYKCTSFSLLI
jgi:hypothetical protein